VGWVRAANDIDRIDAACLFLADAKIRSAPERSTRAAMPGYFASNALPSRSEVASSSAV
jgi:hypothetical protein